MELTELLSTAWQAVKASGVPDQLQAVALKEAIDILRRGEALTDHTGGNASTGTPDRRTARVRSGQRPRHPGTRTDPDELPSADEFFGSLAHESGADETDLRDVFHLTKDGIVQVTPPTRTLGNATAEQAKVMIPLVAGARAFGLGERPVNAKAVREELDRKGCYQQNNFASGHLAPLKGFNSAGRNQIVTTSKWDVEFRSALDKALGRTEDSGH